MSQAQDTPLPAWENLTLPIIVHGLFLASLVAFPPAAIVGVILAHASVGAAGSSAASHFRFQVRTFWLGLAAWALAAIAMFWGGVFSMILIGIPLLVAAMLKIGDINRRRLLRAIPVDGNAVVLRSRLLRRASTTEAVTGGLVMAVTAVLVSSSFD